jgi:DegV family protein with EDD domain
MSRSVALVTDSTACLPPDVAASRDIDVVPLQIVIGGRVYDDGSGPATAGTVAEAMRRRTRVSTSRPTPLALLAAYENAASEGATEVLSIHLSAEMSGTFESATLAARQASVPVRTIDSRQLGMGTGFSVLAAADVLDSGGSGRDAEDAAVRRSAVTTSLFYVDTLEYLHRGGRVGAAAALLGSALAVKPLLKLDSGRIAIAEQVRTAGRALARLEELAVASAADLQVDVAVAHLRNQERAQLLAGNLTGRLGANLSGREVLLGEVGPVIGAHVGPGMVAVVVAPR